MKSNERVTTPKTTITTAKAHGFKAGDIIEITKLDHRWWMIFWHFVRRKPAPVIHEEVIIGEVTSGTTITVQGNTLDA